MIQHQKGIVNAGHHQVLGLGSILLRECRLTQRRGYRLPTLVLVSAAATQTYH